MAIQYNLLEEQVGKQKQTTFANSGSNPGILLMNKIATTVKAKSE